MPRSTFPATVFTLASGRSGTHFLYQLIRRNAVDCAARHETYGFNPSMFGRPIYDFAVGDRQRTRHLLARKQSIVERCSSRIYFETSHAFLKSWFDLAPEYFPDLKVVHLIRDPLRVAKSEASREDTINWLRIPFCRYGAGGRRFFFFSLSGLEPIFQCLSGAALTRFQWYLVQWIEIENRAMRFLDQFGMHDRCFTLHSPVELNDAERVGACFDFLGLRRRHASPVIAGRRNKNWRATVITDEDRCHLDSVVKLLPASYLAIFQREPYRSLPWIGMLQPSLCQSSVDAG